MTRLRRSDPHGPGLSRVRRGRGWEYRMPDGTRITDAVLLERLRAMAIPPAWTDVWISPHENGHVLATGMDDAGRRQYIYHPAWHERMAREKFDRMLQLAAVMPGVRAGVTRDLRQDGFGRPRVLAGAFRMLDSAMLRVGSEQYARQHGSIGLATLRGSHAHVLAERTVELAFPGKSGQAWESRVEDPDLAALVAGLKRRGPRALLLSWQDGSTWHPIRPANINDDVRARTGGDFTAKDFRTWAGTVLASLALSEFERFDSQAQARKNIVRAIERVAERLGNTP
ncbi:MAG TPA: DNA topoisomerase IB, partial [Microbacterium sp.]|nr:DNA topoisomerase IB [Microbacterium sp.]